MTLAPILRTTYAQPPGGGGRHLVDRIIARVVARMWGRVVGTQGITAMKTNIKSALFLLATVGGLVALGGCATQDAKHGAVVNNLTPEMLSLNERPVDAQNATSVSWNADNRMLWNDLGRAALTDRPSRLSKYPVPH